MSQTKLNISACSDLFLFTEYSTAFFETLLILREYHPRKKDIIRLPSFHQVVSRLLTRTQVQAYKVHEPSLKSNPEHLGSTDSILMGIASEDHPVTGEVYDLEPWRAFFRTNAIPLIRTSHRMHFYQPISLYENEVLLISLHPQIHAALWGKSLPATQITSDFNEINPAFLAKAINNLEGREDRKLIETFEKDLPLDFKAFFEPSQTRLFDRAVIFHPEADSSYLTDELTRKLWARGLGGLLKREREPGVYGGSLCHWTNPRFLDGICTEQNSFISRGLVVFELDYLRQMGKSKIFKSFARALSKTRIEGTVRL